VVGFIGRLTQVQNSNSSTLYAAYDPLGRITTSVQIAASGQSFPFNYAYTPSGAVLSMQYPSGKVVNYAYDGAGRPLSVNNPAMATPYASGIQYAPQGAPTMMTFGNQVAESRQYNSLLQTTQIQAGSYLTLNYTYSATQNNGNLATQQIQAGTFNGTQTYSYDTLNRLSAASEGSTWQQTYAYDQFGNRALLAGTFPPVYIPGNALTPQVSMNSAAAVAALFPGNRYTGCQYDFGDAGPGLGAGNATSCTGLAGSTAGSTTLIYDQENRLIWVVCEGGMRGVCEGMRGRVCEGTA
jgi:YD repeat-containing protein